MKRVAALILLSTMSANALAITPFVVSDIRVEGLQRIAAGTVFSYLPINKGDTVNDATAAQAIRALYRTGFFGNIELEKQGNILIVKVHERPSIATLSVRGNKAIKTDALKEGLKAIGLTEGSTFDRMALEKVRNQLTSVYFNQGKYNVAIVPHVTRLNNNRVAVDIEVREGRTARIQAINIVGNKSFTDAQLRDDFESDTPNWTSWYTKDDQYSRAKYSGDLEKLGSYYLDRGYADFQITSNQVAISPNKRDMYLTTSIKEGDIYTMSGVHLTGDLVLPEDTLRQFVFIHKGDTFDRSAIQKSANEIKNTLANIGYAFADVQALPRLDKQNHTVDLTFQIHPGKRIYVRRITFKGNTRTNDEVLRRQMRQLEGSWYSQAAIARSKVRLSQLGYLTNVQIQRSPVPGTDDQVDLQVSVKEQPAGSLQFGVGYSQYSGAILSASVSQKNLFGTGNEFSIAAQRSHYYKTLNLSYVNPYVTDNGVSVGYNFLWRSTNFDDTDFANYALDTTRLSAFVGFPVSETDRISVGAGLERNHVDVFSNSSPDTYIDYMKALGKDTTHTWTLNASYTHETRNSYWAPTRGGQQKLSLEVAMPGSDIKYYKAYLSANHYWPIGGGFVLYLNGEVGYADTYGSDSYKHSAGPYKAGDKVGYPFWRNYFSGGVNDVRGFQQNSLGPREDAGGYYYPTAIGGSFKVLGTAEVYVPLPFLKDVETARVGIFTDVGNVYSSYDDFDASTLRASAGVALRWHAPIGPLVLSYAVPFRTQPGDSHYEQRFQFTFGTTF